MNAKGMIFSEVVMKGPHGEEGDTFSAGDGHPFVIDSLVVEGSLETIAVVSNGDVVIPMKNVWYLSKLGGEDEDE
jgi:hypothetical protein